MADDRIITALDVSTMDDVAYYVDTLGDAVSFYKVGMELFYSVGPDAVRYLKSQGKHVFLDLKLHDIPNTVAQSVRALTRLGADFLTIHGTGGRAMMEAAADAAKMRQSAYLLRDRVFWPLRSSPVSMKQPGRKLAVNTALPKR